MQRWCGAFPRDPSVHKSFLINVWNRWQVGREVSSSCIYTQTLYRDTDTYTHIYVHKSMESEKWWWEFLYFFVYTPTPRFVSTIFSFLLSKVRHSNKTKGVSSLSLPFNGLFSEGLNDLYDTVTSQQYIFYFEEGERGMTTLSPTNPPTSNMLNSYDFLSWHRSCGWWDGEKVNWVITMTIDTWWNGHFIFTQMAFTTCHSPKTQFLYLIVNCYNIELLVNKFYGNVTHQLEFPHELLGNFRI